METAKGGASIILPFKREKRRGTHTTKPHTQYSKKKNEGSQKEEIGAHGVSEEALKKIGGKD